MYETPMQENSFLELPQMSKKIGVEKIKKHLQLRSQVRVNFGILTTVNIFQSVLFH
jgi:hypothetical protein